MGLEPHPLKVAFYGIVILASVCVDYTFFSLEPIMASDTTILLMLLVVREALHVHCH